MNKQRIEQLLQENITHLNKLRNYQPKPDQIIQDQRGTTIIAQPTEASLQQNIKTLQNNISFYQNQLKEMGQTQ